MPLYLFESLKTGDVHEVVYHMNDTKDYAGPDGKQRGQWRRVWTKPRASVDTQVDPYSVKDYLKATNKGGTIGDLHDRSTEMSLKRADKEGKDPVREAYFDNYEKRRRGHKHRLRLREESTATLAAGGIKVEWNDD